MALFPRLDVLAYFSFESLGAVFPSEGLEADDERGRGDGRGEDGEREGLAGGHVGEVGGHDTNENDRRWRPLRPIRYKGGRIRADKCMTRTLPNARKRNERCRNDARAFVLHFWPVQIAIPSSCVFTCKPCPVYISFCALYF